LIRVGSGNQPAGWQVASFVVSSRSISAIIFILTENNQFRGSELCETAIRQAMKKPPLFIKIYKSYKSIYKAHLIIGSDSISID